MSPPVISRTLTPLPTADSTVATTSPAVAAGGLSASSRPRSSAGVQVQVETRSPRDPTGRRGGGNLRRRDRLDVDAPPRTSNRSAETAVRRALAAEHPHPHRAAQRPVRLAGREHGRPADGDALGTCGPDINALSALSRSASRGNASVTDRRARSTATRQSFHWSGPACSPGQAITSTATVASMTPTPSRRARQRPAPPPRDPCGHALQRGQNEDSSRPAAQCFALQRVL